MRKGKHVIGQPVLSFEDGRRVDNVKNLLISEDNESIVALLVDEGGLLSSSRVVPLENVKSFGRDAVVIETSTNVVTASSDPETKAIIQRREALLGKKVMTDQGQSLGSISDLYFEDKSGRITGFEVSGGAFGDFARGTPTWAWIRSSDWVQTDFRSPDVGEHLENQVGGIQGALQNVGDQLGQATSRATTGMQSAMNQREPEKTWLVAAQAQT